MPYVIVKFIVITIGIGVDTWAYEANADGTSEAGKTFARAAAREFGASLMGKSSNNILLPSWLLQPSAQI
jgi:hypothetical protein